MGDAASDAYNDSQESAGIRAPRYYRNIKDEEKRQVIAKNIAAGDLRHWVAIEAYRFSIPSQGEALYNFIKSVKTMPHPYNYRTVEEIKERNAAIWDELI